MKLEQIYTGCLAHGAYYIESDGEAVVIDPLRESRFYLEKARKSNARIKYIFETHFHADFVSGHLELADKTGAEIVYGPTATTSFPAYIAKDGERFTVGKVQFELIHTPGHTLESSCFLLRDEEGKPFALFTGDTIFIGDVGRPDLAQNEIEKITKEDLAGFLYESIHNKLLQLPDEVIIYPAHGAGSACGKNISKETFDTLGNQKKYNYALRPGISKAEFIREVTEGLKPAPAYFPVNVQLNQQGYALLSETSESLARPLSLSQFEKALESENALVLDTRNASVFAKGFIPGSINIGLDGSFAPWVGSVIPYKEQPLLLIADEGRENEVITRLARIGYEYAIGFLQGGFDSWKEAGKPIDMVQSVTAGEFVEILEQGKITRILDVRKEAEYNTGHLPTARNIPLDLVHEMHDVIDKEQTSYVHCAAGYRSMLFISILKAKGHHQLVDVQGGFNALKNYRTTA